MSAGSAARKALSGEEMGGRRGATFLDRVRVYLAAFRQALDAAHHYESLKSLSDQSLAAKGLRREDLPRAVFEKFTRSS